MEETFPRPFVMNKNIQNGFQNVIDVQDQMTFKVLLANRWSPSPEVGLYNYQKEWEEG